MNVIYPSINKGQNRDEIESILPLNVIIEVKIVIGRRWRCLSVPLNLLDR